MSETVKLARYRNIPYKVNYHVNGGGMKVYKWEASKGDKVQTIEVPYDVAEWLLYSTRAISDGELVIVENEELKEQIDDLGKYHNNTHTKDEIIKLLKGNVNKLKSELSKITDDGEKRFIISIAKEIEIDSVSKREIIAKWVDLPLDALFDNDEE